MKIPCFLKEIDGTEYNIWFSDVADMEEFILKVLNENANQYSE